MFLSIIVPGDCTNHSEKNDPACPVTDLPKSSWTSAIVDLPGRADRRIAVPGNQELTTEPATLRRIDTA